MSLTAYLAKNYLTAEPSTTSKKSKKRKRHETSSGIQIANDDISSSIPTTRNPADSDSDTPVHIDSLTTSSSSKFREAKSNGWKTFGAPAPKDSEQKAADEIIARAAEESEKRRAEDEDAPQIVDGGDGEHGGEQVMASGAKAGLQSAAQVSAQMRKKAAAERARLEEAEGADTGDGGVVGTGSKVHETIYRDATGRIVNAALARAEARKAEEQKEREKLENIEDIKGDVQRREAEMRREKLKDAKYMDVARYKDDREMNEELKARERWNDPAAEFLSESRDERTDEGRKKRVYKGGAEPNRYGIRPGHRWDGVDRGNGFEKSWFDARNKVKNRRYLEYAWQMDE